MNIITVKRRKTLKHCSSYSQTDITAAEAVYWLILEEYASHLFECAFTPGCESCERITGLSWLIITSH